MSKKPIKRKKRIKASEYADILKSGKNVKKRDIAKKAWKMSRVGIVGGPIFRILIFIFILLIPVFVLLFTVFAGFFLLTSAAFVLVEVDPDFEYTDRSNDRGSNPGSGGGRGTYVPEHLKGKLLFPSGELISSLRGPRWGAWHNGVDFARLNHSRPAPLIYPMYPGEVIEVRYHNSWGNTVVVKHDIDGEALYSRYAHFADMYVSVGDEVGYHTALGKMGTTGNSTGIHLHLEIYDSTYGTGTSSMQYSMDPLDVLTCDENGTMSKTINASVMHCVDYRNSVLGNS